MSDEQAAALALQGLTAQSLATDVYRIESGDTVLIHAGAGGVGLLLTQIAKVKGARVITTVSTPDKAALSRGGRRRRGADRLRRISRPVKGSHRRQGCLGGVRRGRQGDLRRLAGRAAGARHHGAVRRGERPGAAVRHPAAQPGRLAEADQAQRRSLRPRAGRTAGQGAGRVRLGRRRLADRADRRHLPAGRTPRGRRRTWPAGAPPGSCCCCRDLGSGPRCPTSGLSPGSVEVGGYSSASRPNSMSSVHSS